MPIGWGRRVTAAACQLGVTALLAACSSAPREPAGQAAGPAVPLAAPPAPATPSVPARSVAPPGCSTAAAHAPALPAVRRTMTSVPVSPFGVVTSANGRWVFVSDAHGITVLRAAGPAASPKVVRSVPIPGAPELLGEALTPDGRYLLVAASNETVVLSVAGLESGSSRVLAGALPLTGGGAIAVAVSANGRFAFTSLENSASVEVSNLSRALSAGFNASGVSVGRVPTGRAPVGAAVSPNGRWLYVTSEAASPAVRGHAGSSRQHCAGDPDAATGEVQAIDVAAAEKDPPAAARSAAVAGSSPVRIVLSPGGKVAWVTARGSNALLGMAVSRLGSSTPGPVVADVGVGSAPVGVILVDGGRLAVVADSNSFGGTGPQWLSVVNVRAALAGKPALAGQVPAGGFPRQLALSPDGGTLYVTNFDSDQLETIDVADLVKDAVSG